jgi:hypothetical protein
MIDDSSAKVSDTTSGISLVWPIAMGTLRQLEPRSRKRAGSGIASTARAARNLGTTRARGRARDI